MRRSPLVFVFALTSTFAVAHCSSEGASRITGPYTLTITPSSTPALSNANAQFYDSQIQVPLPLVAKPSLTGAATKPYPAPLWFTIDDIHIQFEYVISNISTSATTVELKADPWNEFIRYVPGVVTSDEETAIDPSPVDRLIYVPAMSRVSGRIAYDDFERAGYQLAMLMNGATEPYHLLDPSTNIQTDAQSVFIPSQIAGITGFTLSLIGQSAGDAVELEGTLELVDEGDHLEPDGTKSPNKPPSKTYTISVSTTGS
jgi:hypothetical protein